MMTDKPKPTKKTSTRTRPRSVKSKDPRLRKGYKEVQLELF